MGSAACAINLNRGGHLGSRDPEHLRRWSAAGTAAIAAGFRCTATTSVGARCRQPALRGECECRRHLRDPERRARADAERRARAQRRIEKGFPAAWVERARATIAALDKRELHKNWKLDPRINAATIVFANEADRRQCIEWLRDHTGVDLDQPLQATGRHASPRMVDRCLWTAWRVIRGGSFVSTDFIASAKNRVRAALRDERAWWRRWDELGADQEAI